MTFGPGIGSPHSVRSADMRKYVIMGIQGSGKGTQARMLAEVYDLVHISVGDIFRWNVQHHTKLGATVKRLVNEGELVGDDLVESVVQERLDHHDWNFGFVLDGFPRTAPQAEYMLERFDLDAVVNLKLADDDVSSRVLSRRLCSGCGIDYNLIAHRPAQHGICDVCGERLAARLDDTPDAVARRVRDFHALTQPVLAIFERKEFVVNVDAGRKEGEIFEEIRRRLCLPPVLT